MNIPLSLPNIVDLTALQNTVALILCSDDRLNTIPILTEIKLAMDNEIALDALWTLPRSAIQIKPGSIDLFAAVVDGDAPTVAGPTGAGLLIEMVQATCPSNNVTGPPLKWQVGVVAFEERNTNLTKDVGTLIMAEQLAQLVLDILQLQAIYGFGTLHAASTPIAPARDWEALKPGLVCWRTTVEAVIGRVQTPRSVLTKIGIDGGGNVTLLCSDVDAEVRYTTDGSVPAKANTNSQVYAAPFQVGSGTLVQAASWKAGLLLSSITGALAP